MTITEALTALSGPLVFGNERQIRARRFLEQVEFAKDAARACKQEHETRADVHTHQQQVTRNVRDCLCLANYADDVRAAAANMLVAEWRR